MNWQQAKEAMIRGNSVENEKHPEHYFKWSEIDFGFYQIPKGERFGKRVDQKPQEEGWTIYETATGVSIERYVTDKAYQSLREGKFGVVKLALGPEHRCERRILVTYFE